MNDCDRIKEQLRPLFDKHEEILVVYLYGSVARGDANEQSDIDIGLLIDNHKRDDSGFGYLPEISSLIQQKLGRDDVDVALLDSISPLLGNKIISEGKVLFCRDESKRVEFHRKAILKYLDTAPLRKLQKRVIDNSFGVADS